ncbi:Actin cytoskeleton-regulatory complex pan-like protein [Quillaja saponaria]|uniref:Actin cytoskeleton-regulatory complex pan-like protein n=1 Tax=Quillaja saponaria TaxID=32244 RepID=A0AAD7LNU1_QUISA|nr:Actin cytoskeleton-regulatory complex pan-like protein [Quillaja saponaria]
MREMGMKDPLEDEERSAPECGKRSGRKGKKGREETMSVRKLAAGIWRMQYPEVNIAGEERRGLQCGEDQKGLQRGIGHGGILPFPCHHNGKAYGSDPKDPSQSPRPVTGAKNGFFSKLDPLFQYTTTAMEGATKWDPVCSKASDEAPQIRGHMKLPDQQVSAVSIVSALESELQQARARIQELETERQSSKKKIEHFLRKVSEERASWRSREHETIHAKVSAKRYMQDYEKERKSRELIEEVCDELAKEFGEGKAEVDALKRETMKVREEVEEERKMLQMAEVWREQRVQMKLVDAKVALEEKYSQMIKLVADLETYLKSRNAISDLKDDIFSIFEDVTFGEANEREIEPCDTYTPASHASRIHTVSPEANMFSKDGIQRNSNAFMDGNGDIEDDESGWETVSHLEDQGSSYSPEGSATSVIKNCRVSNVSGSALEWEENANEETPITEIIEVCSIPSKQLKKVSSIARLWRSCSNNGENYKLISVEGVNGRLSNGRLSNEGIISPDRGSEKGELSPANLIGLWSSPESGNPHIALGKKGCIPHNIQKNSLKAKLLEARMESQKNAHLLLPENAQKLRGTCK